MGQAQAYRAQNSSLPFPKVLGYNSGGKSARKQWKWRRVTVLPFGIAVTRMADQDGGDRAPSWDCSVEVASAQEVIAAGAPSPRKPLSAMHPFREIRWPDHHQLS